VKGFCSLITFRQPVYISLCMSVSVYISVSMWVCVVTVLMTVEPCVQPTPASHCQKPKLQSSHRSRQKQPTSPASLKSFGLCSPSLNYTVSKKTCHPVVMTISPNLNNRVALFFDTQCMVLTAGHFIL